MTIAKSANGPTIDASRAREKNAAMRNPRGTADAMNESRNAINTPASVVGNTFWCSVPAAMRDVSVNITAYVAACAVASVHVCRPMIDMSSCVLFSFSSTSPLINNPSGYNMDMHISRPSSGPRAS